ncbi:MAG: magnesium transporter, partial [Cyclobacteriaceae bacterium]
MIEKELEIFELSKEFLERFQQALDEKDGEFIVKILEGVNAVDITEILYEFDAEECRYVFGLLSNEINAAILIDLDSDVRDSFIQDFEIEQLAGYLEYMDSDDGADVL